MGGVAGRNGWRRGVLLAAAMMVGGPAGCGPGPAVESLPDAATTLAGVGRRLSESLDAGRLTRLAARGDRLLAALTAGERDALARGYARFRLDAPASIFVAAPRGHAPFWLAAAGYRPTGLGLADAETAWDLFRREASAGWVGLGVPGLDYSTTAHYAVFVVPSGPSDASPVVSDRPGWDSVAAADGVSLEGGQPRPVGAIPGVLWGATLLRRARDLRHETLLGRGRAWKTHVVATDRPDQITVTPGDDPSGELRWSWRTAAGVTRSIVRVRTADEKSSVMVTEAEGESSALATPDVLNDPVTRRHSARVVGLTPGRRYQYTLGDGSAANTTDWATVRTPPAAGPRGVKLLYMGDPQCGLEGWGKLLAAASKAHPDAAALLIAGDLVDRGNERTNWDHFFLRAAGVFEQLPLLPAVGNHEYLDRGPRLYRAFFDPPRNGPEGVAPGLVYSVEIGDLFLAVLDSTLAVSDPAGAALQAEWLDARLSRTGRTWKVVALHHPLYASHPTRENPAVRAAWGPVFDRHKVDLVLQGHDHAYLRTYPLRDGRRAETPAGGTVYVVAVSGDKFCDQDPRDYTEVGFTRVSTYQTIEVDPASNRLSYRSIDGDGRERDRFTITKPSRVAAH